MAKFDVVQAWLDNVAYSHSNSENTAQFYRIGIRDFYQFIDSTPEATLAEYEGMTDREFRRKYAQRLRAFISQLCREGFTSNTVKAKVTAVRSFFKYNDLPLGFVPLAKNRVTYHNRDIIHKEVVEIIKVSRPRDAAFFSMMAHAGLRPVTLCKLQLKHIEPTFKEEKKDWGYWIKIPEEIAKGKYVNHFTFFFGLSVKSLNTYLKTRPSIGPEDYVFTSHGSDKQLNRKSMSGIFIRTIEKLKKKGIMDFEQEAKKKPRTVRLYNLRKFFRIHGGQAGPDYVRFWMGHKLEGADDHYFSKQDIELHRKQYMEKAMPHLRLETATASQTDKQITELREQLESRNNTIEELKTRLTRAHHKLDRWMAETKEYRKRRNDKETELRLAYMKLQEKVEKIEKRQSEG